MKSSPDPDSFPDNQTNIAGNTANVSVVIYMYTYPKVKKKKIILKEYFHQSMSIISSILISGSVGVRCSSNSNSWVATVQDNIETLKPSQTVDEVESRSFVTAKIIDNQVNVGRNTANVSVKATRPDLSVGSECKWHLAKDMSVIPKYHDTTHTPLMSKTKFFKSSYWVVVTRSKPVSSSSTAPVALW